MKTDEQVMKDARQRGYDRGLADKKEGTHRNDILSGEWAGESITELLGDLISRTDEDGEQWVCDEYVMAYEEANEPDEKCPICEETWCDGSCEDDKEEAE